MDSLSLGKLTLPDNIKEEIRKNVAELKELLKDDKEFAENLIFNICNVGWYILPQTVTGMVCDHYKEIINQCRKELKSYPMHVNKIHDIAGFLAHVAIGQQVLIYDDWKATKTDYTYSDCKSLGDLAISEINMQYNPDFIYHQDVESLGFTQHYGLDYEDPEFSK
jgi:hypothetical protein